MPVAAAVIPAVAAIGGAVISSNAVGDAANAQAQSAAQGLAEQAREFNINQANYAPWLAAGKSALSQQLNLLGLGGTAATPGTVDWNAYLTANPQAQAAYSAYQANPYGTMSPINAALSRFSGNAQGTSPMSADQFAQNWYTQHGNNGDLSAYTSGGSPAQTAAQSQQSAIDQLQASPLYQSLYRNGVDTLMNNAAATGGLRGGNTAHSLANFGADTLASVIQQQLSNLGGISGNGMSGAGSLGNLNANSANAMSGLYGAQGSAQAGGILGQAGIMNNAFNGIGRTLGGLFTGNGSSLGSGFNVSGYSPSGFVQPDPYNNPSLNSGAWQDWAY